MANVRCPMCSKVNPPEAEVCVYCGARLKPLTGQPSSPFTDQFFNGQPDDEEPDWLRDLRAGDSQVVPAAEDADSEADSEPEPAEEADEAAVPDWLSRIRQHAQAESGSQQDLPQETSAPDEPDWLSSLSFDSAQEEPEPASESWSEESSDDGGRPESSGFGLTGFLAELEQQNQDRQPAEPPASPEEDPFAGWDMGAAETGQTAAGEDTFADWFASSRETGPVGNGQPGAGMDDLDSWFAAGPGSDSSETGQPASGADDLESWFKNGSAGDSGDAGLPAADADLLADWLASEPGISTGQTAQLAGAEDSLPDWLKASDETGAPAHEQDEPEESGLPDWLAAGAESGGQAAGLPADDAVNLDDWFAANSGGDSAGSPEPAGEFNFDDWLAANAGGDSAGLPQSTDGAPGFDGWPAESAGSDSATALEPEGDELNLEAWFAANADAEGDTAEIAQPAAAEDDGMPDWLRAAVEAEAPDGATPAGQAAGEKQPAEGETSGEEALPAWSQSAEGEEPAAAAAADTPGAEPAAASEELPAWLNGDFNALAAETPEDRADNGTGAELAAADWFSAFDEVASDAAPEAQAPAPAEAGSQPEPADEEGAAPDWLAGFAAAAEPAAGPAQTASSKPFIDENTPDWLRAFDSEAAGSAALPDASAEAPLIGEGEVQQTQAGQHIEPFDVELPDWLSHDEVQAESAPVEPLAEGGAEDLAQADLPEWVKDMRPIEAINLGPSIPAETDQRVEKAGPLAGMRGVLPAEEVVSRYSKPPIYSARLRVSEKQRSQASLFDSLLAQEAQPLLVPKARSHAPQVILRLLVAVLLIAVVAFPMLVQMDAVGMPVLMPPDLQNMHNAVEQAAQQPQVRPALLAVDYQPGLSGEMSMTAAPVIGHLMARDVPIVVVSTVPTGPALAEKLLEEAQRENPAYSLRDRTVNLGYLPGGIISLLGFARQPQMTAPVSISGEVTAWDNAILSGIDHIQGFSQVIVLTDSAETGRSWVEQVEVQLHDETPFFMIASAQAAPMLLPYVESGQVDGMVSGVMGGVMYGQLNGQVDGSLAARWPSYQIGVLLAFLLVLGGGLFSGFLALVKRTDKDVA